MPLWSAAIILQRQCGSPVDDRPTGRTWVRRCVRRYARRSGYCKRPGVTFLIIGGDSGIARATLARMGREGLKTVATTRRRDAFEPNRIFLDISKPLGDWFPPAGIEAAGIFAAVANLVDCARDPEGSARVNVDGTIALVERLVSIAIPVLYLSTDKIFDGSRAQMPSDAPLAPQSVYGRQKAWTDAHLQAMIAMGAPIAILRLARIVPPGWPLVRQWRDDLAATRVVRPFRDMMVAPTLDREAASAIVELLKSRQTGVWQLSGARDVSYGEVASFIADRIGADPGLVQPVLAASAGMPEGSIPRHTSLDCSALEQRFGIKPRDPWLVIEEALSL